VNGSKSSRLSVGIYLLLASVALNGVLAGLIIAKKTAPATAQQGTQIQPPRTASLAMPADPRRILRTLTPARRRAVLKTAMQDVPKAERQQFRRLRAALGQAEQAVYEAASADDFDQAQLRGALTVLSKTRIELGKASDVLMINIWAQLTPAERKGAIADMRRRKPPQRRQGRQRPQKQD